MNIGSEPHHDAVEQTARPSYRDDAYDGGIREDGGDRLGEESRANRSRGGSSSGGGGLRGNDEFDDEFDDDQVTATAVQAVCSV